MQAITELKNEHRGVESMLRILEEASKKCARGLEVDTKNFEAILEFLTVFVDRCHHGKEEDFLFPALEAAGVQHDQGPIWVMLQEHEEGRQLITELRDALNDFIAGDKTDSKAIGKIGLDYVVLLDRHIEKEENVLFPMAEDMLKVDKDAELSQAFENLEKERIGPGKHEAFHRLIHRLQKDYRC